MTRESGSRRPWRAKAIGAALVAALSLCAPRVALAQMQSGLNCSGTATGSSTAITFSGQKPNSYVFIVNISASDGLWYNAVGGAAAAVTAGSAPLLAQGNSVTLPPIGTINIISTGSSTAYTCMYK